MLELKKTGTLIIFSNKTEALYNFYILLAVIISSVIIPAAILIFIKDKTKAVPTASIIFLAVLFFDYFAVKINGNFSKSIKLNTETKTVILFNEVPLFSKLSTDIEIKFDDIKSFEIKKYTQKMAVFYYLQIHEYSGKKFNCLRGTGSIEELQNAIDNINSILKK